MIVCSRHGTEHRAFEPCPQCIAEIQADPIGSLTARDVDPSPSMHRAPKLDDPAEALAHRAMEAVQRAFREEFANDPLSPNVTIVVTVPPDGRLGMASTEPDPQTILHSLQLGWGMVHRVVRLAAESN